MIMRSLRLEKKWNLIEISNFAVKLQDFCFIPNILDSLEKEWMPFNHSASNCLKLLLIICLKSGKVMSKQCSGAISVSLFCRIMLFRFIHSFTNVRAKLYIFCISPVQSQHTKTYLRKVSSNVIVLLHGAEKERVQSVMRTLARNDFKSI